MKVKASGKRINISLGLKEAEDLADALGYFCERGSCNCPILCGNTANAIYKALEYQKKEATNEPGRD